MKNQSIQDQSIRQSLLPYFIITICTAFIFRNLLDTYAYTDSYEFLFNVKKDNFIHVFIQGGRVLYGVLVKIAFAGFDSIVQLKYIRLISFIGGLVLLLSLFKLLKYYTIEPIYALGIVLLFAASPSFNIIILWSATFQITWTLSIALLAGILASEYTGKSTLLISILLGVVALNLYQPAYTIFIIPVFLKWWKNRTHKDLVRPLLIHITTYVFYYLIFKFSIIAYDLPALNRGGIDLNIWNSLVQFAFGSFEQALRYNLLFSYKIGLYIIELTVLISITFVYFNKGNLVSKKQFDKLSIGFIITSFFILSMLPNIISSDKWVSLRTMNTLYLLVVIHMVFFVGKLFRNNKYGLKIFLIPVLILFTLISANYNINHGFIDIQKKELAVVKSRISHLGAGTEKIFVIAPELQLLVKENYVKRVVTDEFGRLSTSSEWVPIPMIKMLFKEKFNKEIDVEFYKNESLKPNEVIFDIGQEYSKSDLTQSLRDL